MIPIRSQTLLRPEILPFGEAAFLIDFKAPHFDAKITNHIHSLLAQFRTDSTCQDSTSKNSVWIEIVPGYNSLLVTFDPQTLDAAQALTYIQNVLRRPEIDQLTGKTIEIPVCYGGTLGPDIESVSKNNQLTPQDLITLHSENSYRVCMMGFVPGFTFLSEAPKALHHPRHPAPRLKVPAGSIGLAGWQTGIYGLETPGGWQIIGRTPLRIFDVTRESPFLIHSGDHVKFIPITRKEFDALLTSEAQKATPHKPKTFKQGRA